MITLHRETYAETTKKEYPWEETEYEFTQDELDFLIIWNRDFTEYAVIFHEHQVAEEAAERKRLHAGEPLSKAEDPKPDDLTGDIRLEMDVPTLPNALRLVASLMETNSREQLVDHVDEFVATYNMVNR
jgi:hypothetical protein